MTFGVNIRHVVIMHISTIRNKSMWNTTLAQHYVSCGSYELFTVEHVHGRMRLTSKRLHWLMHHIQMQNSVSCWCKPIQVSQGNTTIGS